MKFKKISNAWTLKVMLGSLLLIAISCQNDQESVEENTPVIEVTDVEAINSQAKAICHQRDLSAEEKANRDSFLASINLKTTSAKGVSGGKKARAINPKKNTIDVVFHFIFSKGFYKSMIKGSPEESAKSQVRMLNRHFAWKNEANNAGIPKIWHNLDARINLRFRYAGVTTKWVKDYQAEEEAEGKFNNGGVEMIDPNNKLNVYVVPKLSYLVDRKNPKGPYYLGAALFPWMKHNNETDGDPAHVVLSQASNTDWGEGMSDKLTLMNQGKSIVHEVGHLLGLRHTFHGGCSDKGDGIWDTPVQGSASMSNSVIKGTITSCRGAVMYQNIMDYSPDANKVMFTKGQRKQVEYVLNKFNGKGQIGQLLR